MQANDIKKLEPGDIIALKINKWGYRYKMVATFKDFNERSGNVTLEDTYKYGKGSFVYSEMELMSIHFITDIMPAQIYTKNQLQVFYTRFKMTKESVKQIFNKTFCSFK